MIKSTLYTKNWAAEISLSGRIKMIGNNSIIKLEADNTSIAYKLGP